MARRLRISSRDLKYVALFAVLSTIITSNAAYIALNPPSSEQFFAMWVLGSTGLADNYYPNNNTQLTVGESVNWTIGVYNHMSSLEYVLVMVKLLNATIPGPDEITGSPSPAMTLIQFGQILVDNETWTLPFVWSLSNVTTSGNYATITALSINGVAILGSLAIAESGFNYRFVFELWLYDASTKQFAFSWNTTNTIWDQLWFNATTT